LKIRTYFLAAASVVAGSLSCASQAAETMTGAYIGGGIGQSKVVDGCDRIAQLAGSAGVVPQCDDNATAFKMYAGYRFLPFLALEAGYTDFGKPNARVGPFTGEVRGWAVPVYAVGILPLANDSLWLMVKGGGAYWNVKETAEGPGLSFARTENGVNFTYGAGVQYNFTNQFGIRAEYEVFNKLGDDNTIGTSDIRVWTVGATIRF
jgi:OOP family OmpA-OmpF porin